MARTAEPACALTCPRIETELPRDRGAGLVSAEAGSARSEIFASAEALEAKALVRQPDGSVRIAFSGGDGIPHSGNQYIAHLNLGNESLRGPVGTNDIDRRHRRAAIAHPCMDLLAAVRLHLSYWSTLLMEAPDAAIVRRHRPRESNTDAVIARREVELALAVPLAGFEQIASAIHAQPVHHVARPPAPIGRTGQAPLRGKHTISVRRGHVALEIGFVSEQAKPVLHLPFDAQRSVGSWLRARTVCAQT